MQPSAARPVSNLAPFVFGHHPLHLCQEVTVGRIPKGIFHKDDATARLLEFFQEQPLMRIAAGSPIGRENDDRLKVAQASLVSQTVKGRAVSPTATDPIIQKEVFRQHGVVGRGHVGLECLQLTLDGIRFLLLARRNAGIQRYVHGWSPSVLLKSG
jgi:hypothetical protein